MIKRCVSAALVGLGAVLLTLAIPSPAPIVAATVQSP
jgi:hypothetical protein